MHDRENEFKAERKEKVMVTNSKYISNIYKFYDIISIL